MNVLVIDDSALARAALRRILAASGAKVFEQASAIGATRSILQNSIDVALVDVSMPGLSGDRLVRLLRDNPRLKGLFVVLVSAQPESKLQALVGPGMADAAVTKEHVERQLPGLLMKFESRLPRRSLGASKGESEGA